MTQMDADEETGKVRLRAWRISLALEQDLDLSRLILLLTYLRSSASSADKSVLQLAPFSLKRRCSSDGRRARSAHIRDHRRGDGGPLAARAWFLGAGLSGSDGHRAGAGRDPLSKGGRTAGRLQRAEAEDILQGRFPLLRIGHRRIESPVGPELGP